MVKKIKNKIFTAANILSMLRILLIPVFILLMLRHKITFALFVLLFAVSTDLLDGIAARIWKQRTKLGTFLDPAADKLLMASSFIILSLPAVSFPNAIPLWLVATVILRDLYIVSGALTYIRLTNASEAEPSILGKVCTVVEMGLLILVLVYNSLGKAPAYLKLVYVFTLAMAVLSAVHYTLIGIRGYRQFKKINKGKA